MARCGQDRWFIAAKSEVAGDPPSVLATYITTQRNVDGNAERCSKDSERLGMTVDESWFTAIRIRHGPARRVRRVQSGAGLRIAIHHQRDARRACFSFS